MTTTEITSRKRKKHSSKEGIEKSDKVFESAKDKKLSKDERRAQKAQKKAEKEKLLSDIPKVDSSGIAYTKIQIRRMVRRVRNGLNPVPTEQEEREMQRQRKRDKQQEDAELAGIIYDRKNTNMERKSMDDEDGQEKGADEDDYGVGDDDDDDDEDDDDDQDNGEDQQSDSESVLEDDESERKNSLDEQVQKKAKTTHKVRSKPVPSGYICQACQNRHSPSHWIYDCPDKMHRPGCNQIAKKDRGIHAPSTRKVFVSGLPFDWKRTDVVNLFLKECGAVVEICKLIMFEDTKRCKGQAFVTFDSEESAVKGLKLNGKLLESVIKKSKQDGENRKELTLGVTKLQNRQRKK